MEYIDTTKPYVVEIVAIKHDYPTGSSKKLGKATLRFKRIEDLIDWVDNSGVNFK